MALRRLRNRANNRLGRYKLHNLFDAPEHRELREKLHAKGRLKGRPLDVLSEKAQ
jgi:hypothetical protein